MSGKVFGVDLETLVQKQWTEVPKIVSQTIDYLLNKKAHLEEGIFRIPGNNIKITQLKKLYDTESNVDLNKHKDLDVHTVACLLKMYLRELPTPVLLPRFYSTYMKVYQNPDPKQRLMNYRKLIMGLPKANRTLLTTVLGYLKVVAENQATNKMSTLNLALIFAPNLMRAERETLTSIMEDADKVAGTLQLLIQENEYLTTGKPPAWFDAPAGAPLKRAKSISSPTPLKRENTSTEAELMAAVLNFQEDSACSRDSDTSSTTSTTSTTESPTNHPEPVNGHLEAPVQKTTTPETETNLNPNTVTAATDNEPQTKPDTEPPTESNTESPLASHNEPNNEPTAATNTDHTIPEEYKIPLRESFVETFTVVEACKDSAATLSVAPSLPTALAQLSLGESIKSDDTNASDTSFSSVDEEPVQQGDLSSAPTSSHTSPATSPATSPTTSPPTSPGRPKRKSAKKEPRPALTNSLGNDRINSKRRLRALSSLWRRSSSDTNLSLDHLKQPDQKIVAKSVNNMKLLRASSDLTTNDKPHRRRLSLMSERIAKNQAFMSHQQLKSFSILGTEI